MRVNPRVAPAFDDDDASSPVVLTDDFRLFIKSDLKTARELLQTFITRAGERVEVRT